MATRKNTRSTTKGKPKTTSKRKKKKERRIPYHSRPSDMTMDQWQTALRIQFGKESKFQLTNVGEHPVFSEFLVSNPDTTNVYKVAIRSRDNSRNFCSCMDFKTNRLGICKHLGFALHKLERKRGHKKIFREGYTQPHSSIYLDYQSGRQIKISIGSDSQQAYEKLAQKYFDTNNVLTKRGFERFEKLLEEGRHINPSFRCYDDAMEYVLQQREKINRQKAIKKKFPRGILRKDLKNLVDIKLYNYQRTGVLFALMAGRCLIADDMGLGKTIQAIVATELYKKHFKIGRVLIVCPTSLKYQWKAEIEKFTKSTVHVVEGNALKRREQYETNPAFYHIVSYHVAARDLAQINRMEPDLLILDEAQRIKNWKTKTSAAVKKIKSTFAFVLTGTPIENKLVELYSILQVIDQFRLGPMYSFLHYHQITDEETGKVIGYQHLKEIGVNLKDILLRRTKKQVLLEMPTRSDKVLLVPMTKMQRAAHEEFGEVVARLVAKWKRYKFLNEVDRKRLMVSLNQMRMVCDSTYILDLKTRHDTKIMELMCILEEFFCAEGEKVVIFSQWSRMLDLVKQELEERDMPFEYLHGGVPSAKRQGLLKNFKDDPNCRVFLSTDAGGVGLNLQVASLVVNMDIPWNPAVLEQRIARVYRLGQKRPVQVINLVSSATIEHKMLGVLKFKHAMAKGVLDDGEDAIFMSSTKFSDFMGKIEDLTDGLAASESVFEDLKRINEEKESLEGGPKQDAKKDQATPDLGEDDDVAAGPETPAVLPTPDLPGLQGQPNNTSPGQRQPGIAPATPDTLVQTGMSFFQGLVQTLQNPEATQNLVSQIVEKDKKSGQTYLKIPVESEALVQNAMTLLGSLLGGR